MIQSNLNAEMRSRIDRFVAELSQLVKNTALESVRSALGETGGPIKRGPAAHGPAKRGPGRPPSTGTSAPATRPAAKRGGKRTTEQVDQMAERLKTFVQSHPGLGLEAIGKGLGVSTHDLKLPVIKLLAARALSKKGEKRGTKYFPAGRASSGGSAPKKKPAAKRRRKAGRKKAKRSARKAPVAAAA